MFGNKNIFKKTSILPLSQYTKTLPYFDVNVSRNIVKKIYNVEISCIWIWGKNLLARFLLLEKRETLLLTRMFEFRKTYEFPHIDLLLRVCVPAKTGTIHDVIIINNE